MNAKLRKMRGVCLAFLLGALPLGNALADDIEIYVGNDSNISGVRPNILFVLDTSGSMDTTVYTQVPYNPATTYAGDCSTNSIYLSDDNNPDCGDGSGGGGGGLCSWFPWLCGAANAQEIQPSYFVCDTAMTPISTVGFYQDRFAQWRSDRERWEDNIEHDNRITECSDDEGTHGQTTGSTAVWPAEDNDGPFSSTKKDRIRWNNYDVYTAYSGNYINWMNDDSLKTSATRIEIMQQVFKDTLDSINNVNVGLMRFDRDANGGMVVHEIADLSVARNDLKAVIDNMTASGNTPLSETLFEAGAYYMGRNVQFGRYSRDQYGSRPSVPESRTNWTYNSPMEFQCQKNFIVYLTDGEPTSDSGADNLIEGLPDNRNDCSGNCMDEMAEYLYEKDLSRNLAGDQNVITYTIGFATDQQLLSDTARKGGGKYYTANDTAGLTNALTDIVSEVLSVNTTFTAPAVSVNAFNRTVHLDQLYFTIFKPSERPHWDGNLKRFDLGKTGTDADGPVEILDAAGKLAVDPNTGFFKTDSISFWTNDDQKPDGGEASKGGAAGDIVLPRKVFTYTGTSKDLTATSNEFHEDNSAISKAALNIPTATDAYRTQLLQWARGVDVEDEDDDGVLTDARRIMGDPLHSKPVVITYGGTSEDPDITIFMTTNDGFLHAVDGKTGSEYFAFIPPEVWSNLDPLYQNTAGANSKIYGLDSPVTAWVYDENNNGVIEAGTDHVYIYFGQRRGGKNYYALDVTNRTSPKLLWQINDSTSGYGELAQTWSQPRVAKVNIGGTVKDVVIFGGGYDTTQDTADAYVPDVEGRAVFMADAKTGARLWWAGPSGSGADLQLAGLKSSIPSEVRVIDMDSDGLSDRMYVGDMGGRIFRFDIMNGQATSSLVKGGMIAALGAGELTSPTLADNRKFFYAPDAALIVDGETKFINLAIGSGNQDHPLGTSTQDRLFSVRDWNIFNVPTTYPLVTEADLYDATDNLVAEGADKEAEIVEINGSDGWFIDLEDTSSGANLGEKSLSEASTAQGNIFFTTFTPVTSAQSDSCAPSQGIARVYYVSARFATAVENFDGMGSDDELTRDDRAMDLTRGGIPPEVIILFPEANDGQSMAYAGPEKIPVDLQKRPVRTYWFEQ